MKHHPPIVVLPSLDAVSSLHELASAPSRAEKENHELTAVADRNLGYHERRGLSLLETIVSGFILSLIVIFMVSLFPSSMIAIQKSESKLEADALASTLIEEVRYQPFDSMAALPPGAVKRGKTNLTYSTEVEEIPGSDPRYLKVVRVTVDWEERGEPRQLVREVWVHAVRR